MLLLNLLLDFAVSCSAVSLSRLPQDPASWLLRRQTGPNYPANTIDMPIDHFPESPRYAPHTESTFKQRYFFDSSYYRPGGPVYLYIGGETSGESRFENLRNGSAFESAWVTKITAENQTVIQILMQATNGLGVILENRYYGESYPFNASSTDQLAYMSTEQTIADNAYFAQHVKFPGIEGNLSAPDTPWILYGGSLAGAQTAFSVKTYGNSTLYGGIASSGVTKVKLAYPEWYDPIQKFAPQDCVSRINGIVDKMDSLVSADNAKAIQQLKDIFGLGALEDIRDFAMTIAFPIGGPMSYPTNTWQELNWSPVYGAPDFFEFCHNVTDVDIPTNLSAVDNELAQYTNGEAWTGLGGWANYVKQYLIPLCGVEPVNSVYCFGTQNQSYWADPSNSGDRSYLYTSCTEGGLYQAAPSTGPSLISRVLQVNYTQQWCDWAFPKGKYNSIPPTPNLDRWNDYGGYDVQADRLAHVDGSQDPWLDVCYHSNDAPQRYSTDLRPELLINGAGHHWDSYGFGYANVTDEPQFIREAHLWEIRTVKRWLADFKSWKPSV